MRVAALDSVTALQYRQFRIVGIDREAAVLGKPLNYYWTWLMQKLGSAALDASIATQITSESRLVNYRGRVVALLKVRSQGNPLSYKGEMVERRGSETLPVAQADYPRTYQRFFAGGRTPMG